jgi:tetratricopeptide (TPR) repeat protein
MARVALRTLTREIEDQIEHGQIDQAIANCRHILTFFPKHVDSYRLLGKAYMEVQRYGDAADVFQRVLSSVPEDFIAHLGMSIIQEDEGNLDEAIWHMERAFEIQPANAAVQGELRRLYGRRDGFEPPKVRLTSGALARMYVKGGLYPQAIAELRSALAEESQRPDLLILLAKAYYLSGQKVEAADTCNSLLSRLPYSLEGNRLLAEILRGSERANEAETYRQRVQALDPYSAHTSASAPNPEVVPDGAVTLERLEWRPGQPEGAPPSQPEWAASLGVNVEGLTPEKESLPDWLSSVSSSDQEAPASTEGDTGESSSAQPPQEVPEQPGLLDSASGLADSLGGAVSGAEGLGAAALGAIGLGAAGLAASGRKEDEEVPDWMREAGWEASKGEEEVSGPPVGEGELSQDEELAPAELRLATLHSPTRRHGNWQRCR